MDTTNEPAMLMPNKGPLTSDDYQRINQRLTELAQVRQAIDQAKAGGCDVGNRSDYCDFLQTKLSELKRAYFPDKP